VPGHFQLKFGLVCRTHTPKAHALNERHDHCSSIRSSQNELDDRHPRQRRSGFVPSLIGTWAIAVDVGRNRRSESIATIQAAFERASPLVAQPRSMDSVASEEIVGRAIAESRYVLTCSLHQGRIQWEGEERKKEYLAMPVAPLTCVMLRILAYASNSNHIESSGCIGRDPLLRRNPDALPHCSLKGKSSPSE